MIPSNLKIAGKILSNYLKSDTYKDKIIAQNYYNNRTDILQKKKLAYVSEVDASNTKLNTTTKILEGDLKEVEYQTEDTLHANHKVVVPFTRKIVDSKVDFILSTPPTLNVDNEEYSNLLQDILDKQYHSQLRYLVKDTILKGTGYFMPFINEAGEFKVKQIPSEQIYPVYKDDFKEELTEAYRIYKEKVFNENLEEQTITFVEHYTLQGTAYYILKDEQLILNSERYLNEPGDTIYLPHFYYNQQPYCFTKLPLLAIRYNQEELGIVNYLKSLVDDFERSLSNCSNSIEDNLNYVLALYGAGAEPIGALHSKLQKFKSIKLAEGGKLDVLKTEINTEQVTVHLKNLEELIYSTGRAVNNHKEADGNISGVSLKLRYQDLLADSSGIARELEAMLDNLLFFIDVFLNITTHKDFSSEKVQFEFALNLITDSLEVINQITSSPYLSIKSQISMNPLVSDVDVEIERLIGEGVLIRDEEGNLKPKQDQATVN